MSTQHDPKRLLQPQIAQALLSHENVQNSAAERSVMFPLPPFIGNEDFVPITCPLMLQKESQLLRHTLLEYAHNIAAGNYYAYQILYPECATLLLALNRMEEGELFPVIKELITFDSKAVKAATEEYVLGWGLNSNKTNISL